MTAPVRHPVRGAVAVVAATLLLAGCGGSDKPTEAPAKTAALGSCDYQRGTASDAVTVKGDFGQTVTPTFKTPLVTSSLRRTVLTKGTGAVTKKGDNVTASISLFNGKDGKLITAVRTPIGVGSATTPLGFDPGLSCVPLGSRVVTTALGKDFLAGGADTEAVKAADTLVIVTDVEVLTPSVTADSLHPKVSKTLPKVTFSKKGVPTLAKLTGTPSPDYALQVLRKGTGKKIKSGETVTFNYQGTSWDSGQLFDSSYERGSATDVRTDQVVPGLGAAMIGQRVGTRLVVSIPPQYGYGLGIKVKTATGQLSSDELIGQTMVFVVELKGAKVTPAQ